MRKFKILLVEDDEDHAELMVDLLEKSFSQIAISHLSDGALVMSRLTEGDSGSRPDLILMDLNMPGITGLELLAAIKSDENLVDIPVVILSTSSAENDVRRALAAHANSYSTKSSNFRELEAKLVRLIHYWMDLHVGLQPMPG